MEDSKKISFKKYSSLEGDASFRKFYRKDVEIIADFFPSEELNIRIKNQKAKVITSFSMFYDLENPLEFAKNIAKNLDAQGIWGFEQS